jgi:biotin carboxyl carrier protein
MAVYRIKIGENEYRIEITEAGIKINDEDIKADLLQLNEAGLYLLNHGDDKLELHMRVEGESSYLVLADGKQILAQVESERDLVKSRSTPIADNELRAPMPGLVISVNVEVGQEVEEGQVVCMLESMKMQMAIHAPRNGFIKDVLIENDQKIEKDTLMIELE